MNTMIRNFTAIIMTVEGADVERRSLNETNVHKANAKLWHIINYEYSSRDDLAGYVLPEYNNSSLTF